MPPPEESLPKRAADLAAALLKTGSLAAAARRAKIPERTARRYAALPAFKALVAEARRGALSDTVAQLHGGGRAAVATLRRKMRSADDAVSVRSAVALLDKLFKAVETIDHEERLQAIEARLDQRDKRGT